jgi:flagellar motor switch/type III secretory pathway protein FliN
MEREMTGTELARRGAESVSAADSDLARLASKTPWMMRIEEHPSWETLAQLRVTLRAGAMLNRFRVSDLLAMKEGQVFESLTPATEDVPVKVGQVQLGWSEFEVLEQRMALRLTRLG